MSQENPVHTSPHSRTPAAMSPYRKSSDQKETAVVEVSEVRSSPRASPRLSAYGQSSENAEAVIETSDVRSSPLRSPPPQRSSPRLPAYEQSAEKKEAVVETSDVRSSPLRSPARRSPPLSTHEKPEAVVETSDVRSPPLRSPTRRSPRLPAYEQSAENTEAVVETWNVRSSPLRSSPRRSPRLTTYEEPSENPEVVIETSDIRSSTLRSPAPGRSPRLSAYEQQSSEKPETVVENSDVRSSPLRSPLRRSPVPPANAATSTSQAASGYRPLNVKDALTYLDQVKIQFAEKPEIYNKFLDIMKDFKSQAIDTPGVIERVSTLFRGHPSLISGFNTFLPPGYRIECSVDEHARNVIKVTTPSGTTSTTDGEPLNLSATTPMIAESAATQYYAPYSRQQHPGPCTTGRMEPGGLGISQHTVPVQPMMMYGQHHASTVSQDDHGSSSRRAPVEFNHAINYVNKIKNRFASEPDTYKQFLEILQTYQKEQKPIQEVYAQVQVLFNGAQDLLDEFKQFLPETAGTGQQTGMATLLDSSGKRRSVVLSSPYGGNRKKKLGIASGYSLQKHSKMNQRMEVQGSSNRPSAAFDEEDEDLQPKKPIVSAEEAEFFDRVQKYIGNKATYKSFLKLLNLFSQRILDQNLLVVRVESFIGGNRELFDWFKKLVGYNTSDEVIDNEPKKSEKYDIGQCESYGPSYRVAPEEYRKEVCSGRDALCNQVLNDEYISSPRWVTENTDFVAHKKNPYEEALHRVEEERYDYDLSIEANLNTIALLEPICKKMSMMSLEEKTNFQLPPGLGGPSKAIYQHVIKKIYGAERGAEIIDLVHNNPVPTVPLLLKRLKQKDEEWKRAQREWNKIWREVEAQNYYKALDYQGVTFKKEDKKAMTTKALLSEIENIRNGQPQAQPSIQGRPPVVVPDSGSRRPPQFTFTFKDPSVFKDITRLIVSFLDRQDMYNAAECENLRILIEVFIPLMFNISDVSPGIADAGRQASVRTEEDIEMTEAEEDEEEEKLLKPPVITERSSRSSRRRSLRSASLDKKGAQAARNNVEQNNSKDAMEIDVEDGKQGTDTDINQTTEAPSTGTAAGSSENADVTEPKEQKPSPTITFFGNNSYYCFLRLYQRLYERLAKLKQLDAEYASRPETARKPNKVALDIGLTGTNIHGIHMDLQNGLYKTFLDLVDILFEGEITQSIFEECARYIFGDKAHIIFTIDKLMTLMIKHMHNILSDARSRDLVQLFKSFRNLEQTPQPQQLATYRLRAEQDIIGPGEKIYGIVYDTGEQLLSIQLLDPDDYALETDARIAYNEYISNFSDFNVPTKGINPDALKKQFLTRNITATKRKRVDDDDDAYVYPGMQYKISKESYHMFYIIDTEDTYIRKKKRRIMLPVSLPVRQPKWRAWLESSKGWVRDALGKRLTV